MKTKLLTYLSVIMIFLLNTYKGNCQLANSSWPMCGHDYRLSNSSSILGPDVPFVMWKLDFNDQYLSGMAQGQDGTIYVNSVSAYYKRNNIGCDSLGYLHSIDPNGSLNWTYTINDGSPKTMSPAVGNDSVIYMHIDGNEANIIAPEKLYAINSNGSLRWRYNGSAVFIGSASSPSIYDDGTIFFGSKGCALFRMNTDGSVRNVYFSPSTSSISNQVPLSNNDRFYLEGNVYSMNGDYLWSTKTRNIKPDIDGKVFGVLNGVNEVNDSLLVFNPDSSILSKYELPWGRGYYIKAMNDSFVVFSKESTTDSISIYIMNKDGSSYFQCSKKFEYSENLSFILDGNNILYILQTGVYQRLYAFNPDGTQKWYFHDFPNCTSFYMYRLKFILGSDKTIYVTGNCGNVNPIRSYIVAIGDLPVITSTKNNSRCGSGTVNLEATASAGTINWYSTESGGKSLGTGTTFTTPNISTTTIYYVDATNYGYTTPARTAVTAIISCTQTNDLISEGLVKVYPNPTNGFVELSINELIDSNSYIELYNNLGVLLKKMSINNTDKTKLIDLSDYSLGLYFLKVNTKKGVSHFKIIKK